jgi:hypothetical protein
VRTLVLSRTYRLGSDAPASYLDLDPADRLLWRHAPRRLDAEEMRDSMLAASGHRQFEPPAEPITNQLKMIEMRDNGPQSAAIQEAANGSEVRSIYLPLLRGLTPAAIAAFDPVTQTLVTGQREATTVPTQALFLLNSWFVRQQSLRLAEDLLSRPGADASRIATVYRLTLGRSPNQAELDRARKFIAAYQDSCGPLPAVQAAVKPAQTAIPKASLEGDDMDRKEYAAPEPVVQPRDSKQAAWMSFVQALYASAEFRFVR